MRGLSEKLSHFYKKNGFWFLGAAALAIILCTLFCGRNIGLSNNGDFGRVLKASSLSEKVTGSTFRYEDEYTIILTEDSALKNVCKILFGSEGYKNYPSVQIPIVRISVVLNLIYNKITGCGMTVYHLGILGLLYSLLYALVLTFLFAQFQLRRNIMDLIVKCIIIVVLCDVGYIAYFDSLYGEALQIISLVFCVACLIRIILHNPGKVEIVLCAFAAVLFGWSKFFNILPACLILALLEGIIFIRTKRKAAIVFGIASVVILGVVLAAVPSWINFETKYNAIFFGIVKDVDKATAEQYLKDLRLPTEMIRFQNTNYYVDGIGEDIKKGGYVQDIESVSKVDLVAFYLQHPKRLMQQMNITVLNCGFIRPYYLSNYGDDSPRLTFSHRFSFWSDLRLKLSFCSWIGNIGVYAAFVLAVWLLMRKQNRYQFVLTLVSSAALLSYCLIIPIISNGEGDITKHMFLFVQLIDMLFLFVITAALDELSERRFGLKAAGCVMMAACLTALPVFREISHLSEENRKYNDLEAGAHIEFGEYLGKKLTWQVTEAKDGSAVMICTDSIGEMQFSDSDGSAWEASSLRAWLNGPFLHSFTKKELSLIQDTENTILLSRDMKAAAASGTRDFYCTQIPTLAARGFDLSYQKKMFDKVTVPDILMVSKLAMKGMDIAGTGMYWLETPYFNNGYMVRCVFPDGYIYFREAEETADVRPVIHITVTDTFKGKGSASDPFILQNEN